MCLCFAKRAHHRWNRTVYLHHKRCFAVCLLFGRLLLRKKKLCFSFARIYSTVRLLCCALVLGSSLARIFLSATEFHRLWGGTISALQYGQNWSDIVLHQGNTWFSYTGDTLRLRMFSLFPDSHSFPIYLIMAIPAFFVLAFKNSVITSLNATKQKAQQFQGAFFGLCFVLGYFAIILSGTRGIWLAALAPLALVLFLWTKASRKYSHYIFCSILVFCCVVWGVLWRYFV